MKRQYPDAPVVGVGGVIFEGEAVLLAQRGQEPGRGSWSLPGGAVELGESVLDALKRELREEVGIEVEIGGLVKVVDRVVRDNHQRIRFHYVIIDYWGWKRSGSVRPGSDISDARFVPLDQLRGLALQRETEEVILAASKMREQARGKGRLKKAAG